MSELQTVTHFLSASEVRIMGSGSLRELLVLEKIAFGGVYVTDPVVATFWGPELTAWSQKWATVGSMSKHMPSYKRQMQIGS